MTDTALSGILIFTWFSENLEAEEMKALKLLGRCFTTWWFYPLLVLYVIFGIWFGSVNYRVHQNPNDYGYWTKFSFYPISTVLREGWICVKDHPGDCLIRNDRNWGYFTSPNVVGKETEDLKKAQYVTMIAVGWPVKVLINAAFIVIIYIVTFVVIAWATGIIVLNLGLYYIIYTAVKFFSLLL